MARVLDVIWVRGNKYFSENPKEKTRQPCQQAAGPANQAAVARMKPTGRREAPPDDRLRAIRGRGRVSPGFRCAPSGLRCSPTSLREATCPRANHNTAVGWVEPAKPIISTKCNGWVSLPPSAFALRATADAVAH